MREPLQALVIGGGIAGTVTAMALQKAGLQAHVFEAFDHGADGVGAILTVAVNGLRALGAIDVPPDRLGGFETPRMALRLGDGQLLTEFNYGPPQPDGLAARTIPRADLYRALRDEALRRGVRIDYGKRLIDAQSTAGGVRARFADGSTVQGDLLIGADGLHSRVRTLIDPGAPEARYVGLLNTGGRAQGVTLPGEVGTMQMFFGKRCFFCYIPFPDGQVWWFANPGRAQEPSRAELAAITPEQWRAELMDLFAGDAMPARQLIAATREILSGWATYDFPRVPVWHRDRMVIIGDAAHATSPSAGQGASMAMEDAVVLAQCLRDGAGVDTAFMAYERLRRARVERVVAMGKQSGDGKTPGPLGRIVRDLMLRLVFARGPEAMEKRLAWVYSDPLRWTS